MYINKLFCRFFYYMYILMLKSVKNFEIWEMILLMFLLMWMWKICQQFDMNFNRRYVSD